MGQTIHAHVEVKVDGKWEHFNAPLVERNYTLFSLLGSEALDCVQKSAAVIDGIPDDISVLTRMCFAQDQFMYKPYHLGWVSSHGLRLLQEEYREATPDVSVLENDFEHSIFRCYVGGNAISMHDGFDDSRLVFWFDN